MLLKIACCFLIISSAIPSAFCQLEKITSDVEKDKPQKFKTKILKSERTGEKKFTLPRKIVQNTASHYNYYFNANNRLNAVIERARYANRDNYAKLLPFYSYSLNSTAAQAGELDSVIYKSTAGILLHDLRSEWVDNFYLLIGRAYLLRKDFDSASMTFQFINYNLYPRKKKDEDQQIVGSNMNTGGSTVSIASKENRNLLKKVFTKPPSRNEAFIWQIRSFTETEEYGDAAGLINTLQNDPNFPSRLVPALAEANAFWFYKQGLYDSAAYYLEKALPNAMDQQEKARSEYLLAQLFERTKNRDKAKEYYGRASNHTIDPLLDIYANLSTAKMYNTEEPDELDFSIATLLKMAKRDKFVAYRDIVYYSAGEIALQKPDTSAAELFYNKSLRYNVNNRTYKNKSFLKLAEINFVRKKYKPAFAYYDSLRLGDTSLGDLEQIKSRRNSLAKIAEQMNIIERQDSLQVIALMPVADREAFVKKLAKRLRKERGLKGDVDYNAINPSSAFDNNRTDLPELFSTSSVQGDWYFYNAAIKSRGFSEFRSRWGKRQNIDNWRRIAGTGSNDGNDNSIVDNNLAPPLNSDIVNNGLNNNGLNSNGINSGINNNGINTNGTNSAINNNGFNNNNGVNNNGLNNNSLNNNGVNNGVNNNGFNNNGVNNGVNNNGFNNNGLNSNGVNNNNGLNNNGVNNNGFNDNGLNNNNGLNSNGVNNGFNNNGLNNNNLNNNGLNNGVNNNGLNSNGFNNNDLNNNGLNNGINNNGLNNNGLNNNNGFNNNGVNNGVNNNGFNNNGTNNDINNNSLNNDFKNNNGLNSNNGFNNNNSTSNGFNNGLNNNTQNNNGFNNNGFNNNLNNGGFNNNQINNGTSLLDNDNNGTIGGMSGDVDAVQIMQEANEQENNNARPVVLEDISYGTLLGNIPVGDEALRASNTLISNALFQLGKLLQNSLEDYSSAADTYERSLQRFPDSMYGGELYMNLYYCYQKLGNTAKADLYKKLLTTKFKESNYAGNVLNPKVAITTDKDPKATRRYENIYNLFIEGQFEKALQEKKVADSLYGENYWSPQLLYIEAVYYIKKNNDSLAIIVLSNIVNTYPNSALSAKAANMINVLSRRNDIENYLTNLQIERAKEDEPVVIKETPVINNPSPVIKNIIAEPNKKDSAGGVKIQPAILNGSYSLAPEASQFVVMLLDKVDPVYISETRNAFNRYNRDNFRAKAIVIAKDTLDNDRKLLVFSQFENADAAIVYADRLKKNAPSEISWLPAAKYSFFIISEANLQLLKSKKELEAYIKLLSSKYPGKF